MSMSLRLKVGSVGGATMRQPGCPSSHTDARAMTHLTGNFSSMTSTGIMPLAVFRTGLPANAAHSRAQVAQLIAKLGEPNRQRGIFWTFNSD
jgi:hypothetical protein